MCIRIALVDLQHGLATWDPDAVTITVQRGTHPHTAARELRAILTDLGAPSSALGLRCFCGDTVPIPYGLTATPPQRVLPLTRRRQVLRGA